MNLLSVFDETKKVTDTQNQLRQFLIQAADSVPELRPYSVKIKERVQHLQGDQLLMFLHDMVSSVPSLRPYKDKILAKFSKAGGIVEPNIDPVTAVVSGGTGGFFSGGLRGLVKGALAGLATEIPTGELITAYENTIRKELPEAVKLPADILATAAAGYLAGKPFDLIKTKLPKHTVEYVLESKKGIVKQIKESAPDVTDELVDQNPEPPKINTKELLKKLSQAATRKEKAQILRKELNLQSKVLDKEKLLPADDLKKAWEFFEKELLGKEIETPIGKKVILKPGHFFKLIAGTDPKKGVKGIVKQASSPEEAIKLIKEGKVKPEDVIGYQPFRVHTIPLVKEVLSKPDIILKEKKSPIFTFFKEFKTNGQQGFVSVTIDAKGNLGLVSWHPKKLEKLIPKLSSADIIWTTRGKAPSPGATAIGQMGGAPRPNSSSKFNYKPDKSADNSDGITLNFLFNPLKALDALHETIRKADDFLAPRLKKTPIGKFLRKIERVSSDFPYLSDQEEKELVYNLYKSRADFAKSHVKAKELTKTVEKWIKVGKVSHGIAIHYLESPDFRAKFASYVRKHPELEEFKNTLDTLRNQIDSLSEELYKRGYLEPEQFNKWKGKYLSRLYQIEDTLSGIDVSKGLKQHEIKKGRKIESIMDLPEEVRKQLGYVEDAPTAILNTVTKAKQILALDEFFRQVKNNPKLVDRRFLVKLPNEVLQKYPELPDEASPYFVRKLLKRLKGNVSQETIKELGREVSNKIKLLENLDKKTLAENKLALLGDKQKLRFGPLSGLPVQKDFAAFLKGYTKIMDDPSGVATKLDKAFSTWIALFKTAKVPLNVWAYPRNFISNIGNWYLSGANRPLSYLTKALLELKNKGRYYKLAERNGLFHTNFADEEILNILKQIKGNESKSRLLKLFMNAPIKKATKTYGWIDDIWKLARMIYAIEREKLPPLKAIQKAQETHFDYSVVNNHIRAMREPNVNMGIAYKLVAPLFPTYMQKSANFLLKSALERPVTTALTVGAAFAVKQALLNKMKEKYGQDKVEKALKYKPDFLPDWNTIIYSNDGKNWYYIPLTYVLPWGWMLETAEDVKEKRIGDALRDVGAFGLPIYTLKDVLSNKDRLGRPIYDETAAELAQKGSAKDAVKYGSKVLKDIASYIWEQTLEPGTITSFRSYMQSRHPVLPRLVGTPAYEYNINEMKAMKIVHAKKKLEDIKKALYRIRGLYAKGRISREEYRRRMREKLQELKDYLRITRQNLH